MSTNVARVTPSNPRVGAEISGIALSGDISRQELDLIQQAILEYGVVFFRDQELTPDQHRAFAARFGPLHIKASTKSVDGHPGMLKIHIDQDSVVIPGYDWHADSTNEPEPPALSILRLHTVPESGGDTLFSSMFAAYDALSARMKAHLEGLVAEHDAALSFNDFQKARGTFDASLQHHKTDHPVIGRHPISGRRLLYVNSTYTRRIRGLPERESRALLDYLFRHIEMPEFQVRFKWQAHSIAFWDNRAVQHLATWDYFPATRSGFRVSVQGPAPVAA